MLFEKIKQRFSKLKKDEPLKSHSTMRVGGPADLFYELVNVEELPELITVAEECRIPYRIIGRGTNCLFTDKGFRGLIIKNISHEFEVTENRIRAQSGVLLSQIIRASVDHNLTGLEPLYGLPGSIGGAAWGNAGVPGTEIGQCISSLVLFNTADGVREIPGSEIKFNYRSTSLQSQSDIILYVTLSLSKGDHDAHLSKEIMKKINEIRLGKQPTGFSAGSFFRNPSPDKPAGILIDKCGLKGAQVGGAQISSKHGNFFMNTGNATCSDILTLAENAKKEVITRFGIALNMEVKIVGDL